MTIFKRKSTPPTVSPLAPPPPPPASTYHPQQQQQQYQQTQQYASRPPQQPLGSGSGQGSYRGQQQLQPPNGHMRASPNDLARIGTNGTTGSVSSRSEKRRSGFFGLGGKKDKEKERIEKEEKEREKLAQGQMQMQGVSILTLILLLHATGSGPSRENRQGRFRCGLIAATRSRSSASVVLGPTTTPAPRLQPLVPADPAKPAGQARTVLHPPYRDAQ